MLSAITYTIISVLIVSLVSFIGVLSLSLSHKTMDKLLLTLVSISAGTLFGGALLHLLPEAAGESGLTLSVSLLVLLGVIIFFAVERLIHLHHCVEPRHHSHPGQQKEYIGFLSLTGDGFHNFLDGLIIAGAYLIDTPVGIATTIAVIIHEIPQEIADFGVLLYSGFSKAKALFFNFLSAATAILGAIVGLLLSSRIESFSLTLLPIATGGFLYIAGSNLIPELHKECGWKESIIHFGAMLFGIALMVALLWLE